LFILFIINIYFLQIFIATNVQNGYLQALHVAMH